MRRTSKGSLAASILLAACGLVTDGPEAPPLQQAIGEPNGTFPSPEERLMLMALNRARSDPATVKGTMSTVYPARPPVSWNYDLSRSSRFHAINMMSTGATLMHTSPCKLNTNVGTSGCTGIVSCACATPVPTMCNQCKSVPAVNTCGTDTFTRIGYFSNVATGEIAAAGYPDTFSTVNAWVFEATGADGHRQNILDVGVTSNTMGAGRTGGSSCWASFDVSDSGFINGQVLPKMPTGSVKPVRGPAGNFTFYVTWADPTLGAPSSLSVVIDGTCQAMTRELGASNFNSTWLYTGALAAGCHSYYFFGRDAGGTQVTYPTVGALNVSVGGTACPADYFTPAPAPSCQGVLPDLGGVTSDLAVGPPDLAMGSPDLRKGPDMTRLPDLARVPDFAVGAQDLAKAPDLAVLPDLTGAVVDQATVPADLTIVAQPDLATVAADLAVVPGPDLTSTALPDQARAIDLAAADLAGADLSPAPDLRQVTTLSDLAGQPPPPDQSSAGDDLSTTGMGLPKAGCGCQVGSRRSPGTALGSLLLVAGALLLARRRTRPGA